MSKFTQQHSILSTNSTALETKTLKIPAVIFEAGPNAQRRFIEFFTANIRNPNTRHAYHRAITDFFVWCDERQISLLQIEPVVVATYIEYQSLTYSAPTVKQQLAAIRMLFDWLVIGQIVHTNPSTSVRGPRHVVKKGKTPVLSAAQARKLLNSIDTRTGAGIRDKALISIMIFSFARIGAVVSMNVKDFYAIGNRSYLRFIEKGGKHHEVPAHRKIVDAMQMLIPLLPEQNGAIFTTANSNGKVLKTNRLSRHDALRLVKRRAIAAGLPGSICCHTFRATGITAYLENGGTIENAQAIAAHESPRTTKLYDRRSDQITLDEIERILI